MLLAEVLRCQSQGHLCLGWTSERRNVKLRGGAETIKYLRNLRLCSRHEAKGTESSVSLSGVRFKSHLAHCLDESLRQATFPTLCLGFLLCVGKRLSLGLQLMPASCGCEGVGPGGCFCDYIQAQEKKMPRFICDSALDWLLLLGVPSSD